MSDSEISAYINHQKFLGCLMSPARHFCCRGSSLRVLVVICLIIDCLWGLMLLIKFLDEADYVIKYAEFERNLITWSIENFMNTTCLITACIAAFGINELSASKMRYYSIYKHAELFILPLNKFWENAYMCARNDIVLGAFCRNEAKAIHCLILFVWYFGWTYGIWSTTKLLELNQGAIVVSGESAGYTAIPTNHERPRQIISGGVILARGQAPPPPRILVPGPDLELSPVLDEEEHEQFLKGQTDSQQATA